VPEDVDLGSDARALWANTLRDEAELVAAVQQELSSKHHRIERLNKSEQDQLADRILAVGLRSAPGGAARA
jgi:hypothetical protein